MTGWVQVTNVSGTSDRSCVCGTWLNHWLRFSGHPKGARVSCAEIGCIAEAQDGAHVFIEPEPVATSSGAIVKAASIIKEAIGPHYIVPLCDRHHRSTTTRTVDRAALVSANREKTCEQPVARR